MFQPVRRDGPGNMQPNLIQSQNDANAKEKLSTYIYEYLSSTGASKTAETFKEEVLNNTPSFANYKPDGKSSFLLDWWTVFWDLYCAAPERRDSADSTTEAKYFHDNFISGFGPCGMNGGPPFGAPGMGMPGPEGMMGVHPGGFPGRFPPGRMPPGAMPPAGFGMFPGDPRMARMPPTSMRMPPGSSFPGAQMRPGVPPAGAPPGALPPGMRYGGFMDGQGFPPGASGMMPNGMPMAMSSPGMPGAVPPDANGPPPFMSMGGMPTSSSAMPFGMGDTSVTMGNGSVVAPPVSEGVPSSNASGITPGIATALNGDELKQSPASTPRAAGVTGGTPAPGPGSAQSGAQPNTPLANVGSVGAPPIGDSSKQFMQDDTEISKIKEGLLDGFDLKQETNPGESFFS
ncbi:unnamed protein product [Caenorhabditis auriculariae]|uniref:LisH domain-containing protein n=1 Tax=Caenorhabditis auriculariae TaxID=2777116 RepID=A0A8S1HBI9_9PELO|nr:unnamed protein product [Caenorhabditis auriculariae]